MNLFIPIFFSIDLFHKEPEPCSVDKMQEILSLPLIVDPSDPSTWKNRSVEVNCDVTLEPEHVVTKSVRFVGPDASNLVFDCNGATLDPLGDLEKVTPALVVTSARRRDGDLYRHERVQNVTIKNCRIKGSVGISSQMYRVWDEEAIAYKNQRGPDYVKELRNVAPRNITLDNVIVENDDKVSLYINQGVTYVTLKNSVIKHQGAHGPSIYIDAESAFNTIDNNEFHHSSSNGREVLSIDGSEHNLISRNWFSGARNGGVFLYRNCGEQSDSVPFGELRYTGVRNNEIRENIFYYSKWTYVEKPSVWIGSRDGNRSFCSDDNDVPYQWNFSDVDPELGWDADWQASNADNRDFARYNTVTGNRFCNASFVVGEGVEIRNGEFNFGNIVGDNTGIACDSSDPFHREGG